MSRKRTKGKPDSWMPLFFGDFNADTAHLSLEQRMAYLNILWWMWRNGARAPNDDRQLAAISGLGTRKWKTARTMLIAFFSVSDKWLFQKRLSEEYEHAWKVYKKRVDSGKQGGRPSSHDLFDDTERDTERLTERPPESPPPPQPPPATPTNPPNHTNSPTNKPTTPATPPKTTPKATTTPASAMCNPSPKTSASSSCTASQTTTSTCRTR